MQVRAVGAALLGLSLVTFVAACDDDGSRVESGPASSTSTTSRRTECLSGARTTEQHRAAAAPAPPVALLTAVRSGAHGCFDRIVFDFRETPPGFTVGYQPGPFYRGESGQPLSIPGSSFLVVRLAPAAGIDLSQPDARPTYTGDRVITPPGLAHVRQIVNTEDFEAQMVWVIGVDGTRPFVVKAISDPTRVYVDIGS